MRQFIILVFILSLISVSSYSQEKTYDFKGKVYSYGDALKGAKVEVYEGGDLVYETESKGGGKFDFELKAERQYMVEIYTDELQAKTIWINTKNTQELDFKIPSFGFDVYLKKEKPGPLEEMNEIPVTLIKYDPKKKEFYMDKTYEDAVKNKKNRIKESTPRLR